MDMNQIAVEVAYAEGYEAGKQAAVEELLDELDEILTAKLDAFNKVQKEPELMSPLSHEPEYWNGRAVTCGEILQLIANLKKKYGVN